jgi:UDP-glucuronate 4-epimerase
MALFKFTKAILDGTEIEVFNYGKHIRDFTYIDDVVEAIIRVLDKPSCPNPNWNSDMPDPGTSNVSWSVFNIGNSSPIPLMEYISVLENELGLKAKIKKMPLQKGDVEKTNACVDDLIKNFNYQPTTTINAGISHFVSWYRNYFNC